jgi:hypothetical protein
VFTIWSPLPRAPPTSVAREITPIKLTIAIARVFFPLKIYLFTELCDFYNYKYVVNFIATIKNYEEKRWFE